MIFFIEVAHIDDSDISWLHTVREIPGFLSVGVIELFMVIRKQVLGLVALLLLGVAIAITAWFQSIASILAITMLSLIGFHCYETVNQSAKLQWLDNRDYQQQHPTRARPSPGGNVCETAYRDSLLTDQSLYYFPFAIGLA